MSIVSFQNVGLIPIEAITTLGVNAKESDSPIGYFGTGLKYAIAVLLRTGHRIKIFRGLEALDFHSEKTTIRGKDFEFIVMTHLNRQQRLGFTTDLGKNWEMWQVFRELYANCLDESGEMSFESQTPRENFTLIEVFGEDFCFAAHHKEEVFLQTKPLEVIFSEFNLPYVEIHQGKSLSIFYRGLKCAALNKPTNFTYNILYPAELTEDRTLKHMWIVETAIEQAISLTKNKSIIEQVLTNQDFAEYYLYYANGNSHFYEYVIELAERLGPISISPNAMRYAESWAQREARVSEIVLSLYENIQLFEAKKFLKEIGFDVSQEIIVAKSLGANTYGCAKNGKIYLSKTALDKGGNWLIGTILEEHLHITQGFKDETRDFQNFLLDLAIKFAKELSFYKEKEFL